MDNQIKMIMSALSNDSVEFSGCLPRIKL